MMRFLHVSGLALALFVSLAACTTEWETASSQTVVTDDGKHMIVTVRRERVTKKQIVYSSTSNEEISTELWLVPIPAFSTDSPRRLPDFSTPPPNFHMFYPMLAAGYLLVHNGLGTFVVDPETGESQSIGTPANDLTHIFVPSLDGKFIAHVSRADELVCEGLGHPCELVGDEFRCGWVRPCELRVDFLDAQTLAVRASVPLSLADPVWAGEPPIILLNRVAWTEANSFRVTSTRTVDITLDGLVREVPLEPCYVSPTSSGRVNRRDGLIYEQHVNDEGEFTEVTTTPVETLVGWPSGCLAEPRPAP
jgi:hypothetical protein